MRGGQCVVELRQAKSDEDAEDASVVAKVQVECLVDRECDRVVVKGDVDLSRGRGQDVVLHASKDFFDIACGGMLVNYFGRGYSGVVWSNVAYLYR